MLHTLQRHRDILADLSRDFRKTNSQREARRERADLLRSSSGKTDSFRTDGVNNRRDVYLKENSHIHKYVVLFVCLHSLTLTFNCLTVLTGLSTNKLRSLWKQGNI